MNAALDSLALINDLLMLEGKPAAFFVEVGDKNPHTGENVDRDADEKSEEDESLEAFV